MFEIFPETKIGKYILIRQIGIGSFSHVWLAYHEVTKTEVAIKIIDKKLLETEDIKKRFIREECLMKQLNHPFIAEFFEIIEDSCYYYLVIEYVENGNMLNFINSHGRLSEPQARRYFSQIISVLEYLHKEKFIAHRDLKAENVLLDKYENIRIIDFGFSNFFSESNPNLYTPCGSPAYAAPEMIKRNPYTTSVDIWSAGVLLYAMVAGQLPFDDSNNQRLLQKIAYTEVCFPPFMSPPLVDLLNKLLCKDPKQRMNIDSIKEHVWFSQSEYALLQHLRTNEPTHNQMNKISIDKEIVDRLTQFGIDTKPLYESIINNDFNETRSVYRQLARAKSNKILKGLMMKPQINLPSQQSTLPLFSFDFKDQPANNMNVSFIINNDQQNNGQQINGATQSTMSMMKLPPPANIIARRLSRPVALKRTIGLPSAPSTKRTQPREGLL